MGKRKAQIAMLQNDLTYCHYYYRLKELAISMFQWDGLPDSVDERFLELVLCEDGKALFFYDDVLGYLTLQCTINGMLNVYRIPIERRAYATNGYNANLSETNSVIIWNNMLRTNMIPAIKHFALKLANIDRTIDVNVHAQKTPILITCDETQRLTMENLYNMYDGNSPIIFGNKDLDVKRIGVLNTNAPYVSDKLMELKNQVWNEALTYLGVSNVSYQKRERLISDEVSRSMGGTIASRNTRLNARKQACDEINKMFGLNISVSYKEDYQVLDLETNKSEVDIDE